MAPVFPPSSMVDPARHPCPFLAEEFGDLLDHAFGIRCVSLEFNKAWNALALPRLRYSEAMK